MSVTESLLRVFRVDQQLAGLQSRLRAAEKFLDEQTRQIAQIDSKRDALNQQLRQTQALIADHEGEMQRVDAKVEHLREQMNSARTNKEYKAFLTEMNTFKADKSASETAALEHMTKADELRKQVAEFDAQRAEREKLQKVAQEDRAKKADEIKDRLAQLQAERATLVKDVPADMMKLYLDLVRKKGDEAMAPVHELDRRSHDYACGSCQMTVTVETVNALLRSSGATAPIVQCGSCGCILYIDKETVAALQPGPKRGKLSSTLGS